MKIILISIVLLAILSFSAYAGCCLLETSPDNVYWDFGNWLPQSLFCRNLGGFFKLNYTFYTTDCDNTTLPAESIDGWGPFSPITIPTTGGGGGGGRSTRTAPACVQIAYTCNDWSECVNDMQSRDCTKKMVCGNIPSSQDVKEERSCTPPKEEEVTVIKEPVVEETVAEEITPEETAEGAFAAITGAVIGAIGKAPVAYGITFVVVIGILIGVASLYTKKKKAKKKE